MRIRTGTPLDPPKITDVWSSGLIVRGIRTRNAATDPSKIILGGDHEPTKWDRYRKPRTRFALKWYSTAWIYRPPDDRKTIDCLAPSGALVLRTSLPKLVITAPYEEECRDRAERRAIYHILMYPAYAMNRP